MTISNLQQVRSRILVFGQPMICRNCKQDVFIPYELYINVKRPAENCLYAHDIAICQNCGEARHFYDPSHYDNEIDDFVWALEQEISGGE